ncbi:metallophosphoesterase family protein [Streptomyces sp. NPDC007883]|uniref:metallophosphoesterase family protein n=1 Tax=Streptomyces sp. NPDC007883 TaxID=3155116 RepID=UPI003401C45F
MPNRVAVLSDIHGVLPALEAVLAEPDVRAADRIVLTGDIAAGPQPGRVLDLLAPLGDRASWVSGNADRELVACRHGTSALAGDAIDTWAAGSLRADQPDLLAGLPASLRLPVSGLGDVLFCHATPRDDEEVVLVDSRPERRREVLAGLDGDVRTVVCGHTHMPFVRLADGRLVVNPGSVGMPYGRAGAHWALLGPGLQLRVTGYDIDAAIAQVTEDSGCPGAAAWAAYHLRARATDTEALAFFAERDGRGGAS